MVPVEVLFLLGRWEEVDLAVRASVVERVDVLGDPEVVDARPGPVSPTSSASTVEVEAWAEALSWLSAVEPAETTAPPSARRRVQRTATHWAVGGASVVQPGAAQIIALDERDRHIELRAGQRGRTSGATSAEETRWWSPFPPGARR